MPIEQIVTIVIAVFVIVIIWGIFKKLFKLLFYAGLIIALIIAANWYFIYQDFNDLRENFGSSSKKVLLIDDNEVLVGLILAGDVVDAISQDNLNEISSELRKENYDAVLGEHYRLMIFDSEIIDNLKGEVEVSGKTMQRNEIIEVLKLGSNQEKASLFSDLLADHILGIRNPILFFSEFKDGNIKIYPETALFKSAKVIPVEFFKDAGKKIFDKGKEKVKIFIAEEIEQ
jgi:energy-coupling factor transporter transmembrane protein EcfT